MSKESNKSIKKKKSSLLFINKEREPLFSKKNRVLLTDPLDDNNPITVQVLGICSALAITAIRTSCCYEPLSSCCYGC